jgi:hypothetical protein
MSSHIGNQISDRANDGDYNQFSDGNQCAKSKTQAKPYWGIDLLHKYKLEKLVIHTNAREENEILGNFKVYVAKHSADFSKGTAKLCAHHSKEVGLGYRETTVECNADGVRYLEIHQEDRGHLYLCEVEIYGYLDSNHALDEAIVSYNSAVAQSSTDNFYEPHLAVDGSRDPIFRDSSCSRTKAQNDPWWEVHLHHHYNITGVVVYPQKGQAHILKPLEIFSKTSKHAEYKLCAKLQNFNKERLFFDCHVPDSKYIRLVLPENREALTLCEVRVYAMIPIDPNEKYCAQHVKHY